MALQPPARAPLGDQIATTLRDAILSGSLKPGEPLHENALAQQLSVSRSPIREALLQLERERLIVTRLNRSAVVRRPTPQEINQIYTIRAALEGVAARWAADNATAKLVSVLRRKAETLNTATMSSSSTTAPKVVVTAIDFHASISDASDSVELQCLLQSLCNQIRLVMTAGLASLTPRRAEEIHAEHLAIIEAISGRDGDRAEQLATEHVRGARDRLVYLSEGNVRTVDRTDH
jgi:DNA-binding GntR family transcriptional regulator